ncbi:hypothetical protein Moror_9953 [Moniliophthora roreri MCA 2997]|uniref:Uncharacterized protein n=1 Tax=Moniliophthora roreri (strain MCA 2997) TaxID=1381753 RepID=V2WZR4_MONRO|nr:hypothetical protein Moror_9953 [Moniliophthora roreri MCA 2997]
MFGQSRNKTTNSLPELESLFPLRESYTREPPPIPEEMKDKICVWGFELTEATLGSHPLGSMEEFQRCKSILQSCREISIGPPKAQLALGRRYVLGLAQYSPYRTAGVPDAIPSAEKIEHSKKKIHLEGEPKWVYRF